MDVIKEALKKKIQMMKGDGDAVSDLLSEDEDEKSEDMAPKRELDVGDIEGDKLSDEDLALKIKILESLSSSDKMGRQGISLKERAGQNINKDLAMLKK